MAWQQQANDAWVNLIQVWNHRPTWTQAKAPNASQAVDAHVRHFNTEEAELINTYGQYGVEIIAVARSFPQEPEKLDRFIHNGETFTVQSVLPTYGADNTLLLYRMHCRGAH